MFVFSQMKCVPISTFVKLEAHSWHKVNALKRALSIFLVNFNQLCKSKACWFSWQLANHRCVKSLFRNLRPVHLWWSARYMDGSHDPVSGLPSCCHSSSSTCSWAWSKAQAMPPSEPTCSIQSQDWQLLYLQVLGSWLGSRVPVWDFHVSPR